MKKRGQITIFVILAILVVGIILAFIFIRTSAEKEELGREYFQQQGLKPSLNNIQDFIIDCHEETSTQALIRIGIQGGYYNEPEYYFDMEWAFIPYYYYEGLQLMPTKTTIQQELTNYVDNNIQSCLDKIKFQNFKLNYQQPTTQTSIIESKVIFNTNQQLTIEHEGSTTNFELNQHPLTLESSLNEILEVASFITTSHTEDPDLMCINCITELAKERDLYVDFIAIEEDTTLVMILENRTLPEPYIFEFMNKYIVQEAAQ